jgi:hypothetical protein
MEDSAARHFQGRLKANDIEEKSTVLSHNSQSQRFGMSSTAIGHAFILDPDLSIPIALLSKRGIISPVSGGRLRVPSISPTLTFHFIRLTKVVKQSNARCIAAASSNSILCTVSLAEAVLAAVTTQCTHARQLDTTMTFLAIRAMSFFLNIDSALLIISTKKK